HFIENANLQLINLKGTGWELDIPNILTISTVDDLRSGIENLRTLCYNIQPMLQKQKYENMLSFLEHLPNVCNNIEKLELSVNIIDCDLERVFSNIISSQNSIIQFILYCDFVLIIKF